MTENLPILELDSEGKITRESIAKIFENHLSGWRKNKDYYGIRTADVLVPMCLIESYCTQTEKVESSLAFKIAFSTCRNYLNEEEQKQLHKLLTQEPQVGDKVWIKIFKKEGEIVDIDKKQNKYRIRRTDDGIEDWFGISGFDLIKNKEEEKKIPKPKFRVGDRIRIISTDTEDIISEVAWGNYNYDDNDDDWWYGLENEIKFWYTEDQLELVDENESPPELEEVITKTLEDGEVIDKFKSPTKQKKKTPIPKFKVGDRVIAKGKEYTIQGVSEWNDNILYYRLYQDEHGEWWWFPEGELKLVETTKNKATKKKKIPKPKFQVGNKVKIINTAKSKGNVNTIKDIEYWHGKHFYYLDKQIGGFYEEELELINFINEISKFKVGDYVVICGEKYYKNKIGKIINIETVKSELCYIELQSSPPLHIWLRKDRIKLLQAGDIVKTKRNKTGTITLIDSNEIRIDFKRGYEIFTNIADLSYIEKTI